uniref:RRM domain-containing protein n=2 Tax=Rhodosorus marinus TaxID=101924 RepID=A0A7S3EMY0_9RHOD|mmetsp:Transcript_47/g.104  ORF Transcript_47/g.104 Transcript_47/m.104 type:complete len:618 (+) Transcript_47:503-2356(+)
MVVRTRLKTALSGCLGAVRVIACGSHLDRLRLRACFSSSRSFGSEKGLAHSPPVRSNLSSGSDDSVLPFETKSPAIVKQVIDKQWNAYDLEGVSLSINQDSSETEEGPLFPRLVDDTAKVFGSQYHTEVDRFMETKKQAAARRYVRFKGLPSKFENHQLVDLCEPYSLPVRVIEEDSGSRIVEFERDVDALRVVSGISDYIIEDRPIHAHVISYKGAGSGMSEEDTTRKKSDPRKLVVHCSTRKPEKIREICSEFGSIKRFGALLDGSCFVEYERSEDARNMRSTMATVRLGGESVRIEDYVTDPVPRRALSFKIREGEPLENLENLLRDLRGVEFWFWRFTAERSVFVNVVFRNNDDALAGFWKLQVAPLSDYFIKASFIDAFESDGNDPRSCRSFLEKRAKPLDVDISDQSAEFADGADSEDLVESVYDSAYGIAHGGDSFNVFSDLAVSEPGGDQYDDETSEASGGEFPQGTVISGERDNKANPSEANDSLGELAAEGENENEQMMNQLFEESAVDFWSESRELASLIENLEDDQSSLTSIPQPPFREEPPISFGDGVKELIEAVEKFVNSIDKGKPSVDQARAVLSSFDHELKVEGALEHFKATYQPRKITEV